jgi:hypothetical protein
METVLRGCPAYADIHSALRRGGTLATPTTTRTADRDGRATLSDLDAPALLQMSQQELDDLFRASPAGPIPKGVGNGEAIVLPGTPLAGALASTLGLLWRGKVFFPKRKDLLNRILPFGLRAVRARVYRQDSWFDHRETIVLDYSKTSVLAHYIRDEIREVAPNLYLGIVYWGHTKTINFALDFAHQHR